MNLYLDVCVRVRVCVRPCAVVRVFVSVSAREGGVSVSIFSLTLGFLSPHVSLLMSNSNVSVDIDSLFLHFVAGIGKARTNTTQHQGNSTNYKIIKLCVWRSPCISFRPDV